jgi:hypothetical protein
MMELMITFKMMSMRKMKRSRIRMRRATKRRIRRMNQKLAMRKLRSGLRMKITFSLITLSHSRV